ncbi:hypothetical protein [Vibrio phage vB_VibM_83AMN]|nr:hypothetical protein [Vibrio phage vB_VibM_83AMN]
MYNEFAKMGTEMLKSDGAPAQLQLFTTTKNVNEPWRDDETSITTITGLHCAIFDYIKKYNKKGQVVESTNTAYIDVANLKDYDSIPLNSILITQGKKWSVKEAEFIRPAGINTLLILWVSAYG